MKNLTIVTLAILFMIACNGQKRIKGNGNVVTIERTTSDYNGIQVGGFYEVELVEGTEGKITLRGEDNILEYIETEVKGGTLIIKSEDDLNLNPPRGEGVYITIPVEQIDAIRLSGTGKFIGKKTLEAKNFKVHTSGVRNAELTIKSNSITIITSGSSDVELSGNAENINVTSSGSSNVKAFNLNANDVEVRSSGSSDVEVTANQTLDTRVSGSGDVRYRGNPSKIKNKLSGSGKTSKN